MEFSRNCKIAMRYAEEYAKRSGGTIGTEHIMAGIISVNCKAAKLLAAYGIDRNSINDFIRFGNTVNMAVLSSRGKGVLNESAYIAESVHSNEITTEIVMLAILNATDSVAVRALAAMGVDFIRLGRSLRGAVMNNQSNEGGNIFIEIDKGDDIESMNDAGVNFDIDGAHNRHSEDSEVEDETLKNICHDLTLKAKKKQLDPVIGRGKEIDRIIQILSRRTKNNPVLIGEPGVGKSAIVEGLAQAIVEGNVPDILLGKKVLALDMASVLAGTKYRGEFEERLQNAIKAIKESGDIILFIDEIHTIVGAGASEGSVDAANILKPLLARGELQTIGATTIDEYRKYIEKDPALERRFQPIMVDPPSVEDTIAILTGLREKYEKHHGVEISDSAIKAAAELSDRYISDRFLPDKAIDLIDEAASKKRIKNFVTPDSVKELEDKIQRIELDIKKAARNEEYDVADKYKKEREELKKKCDAEKKKWAESRKDVKLSINDNDVAEIVSLWTNIPVVKLTESEADRLLHLEDILKKRVVGQDEAVTSVAKAVRRARAGLKDPKKPIGSFIFLGPTGVGKTELTKALAEAMFGDEDLLIRLDMSEYMDKISVSKLIGSAPGYVGFEEGGQLTEKVRRKPYSVVLFDEIEKAHPDVFNMLLQILDDGRLTDSHGRTVSFKNTIIIMTSNIGASEIKNSKLGFGGNNSAVDYDAMKEKQMEALKRTMKPEFINRIDDIIIFKSLEKKDIDQIADILITNLAKRLKGQNINIEVTAKAKDFIVTKGFNSEYGARPLKRAIQKNIEDELSEQILMNKIAIGDNVVIDADGDKLTFTPKK